MSVAWLRVAVAIGRDEGAAEQLVRALPAHGSPALVLAVGDPRRLSKRLKPATKLTLVDVAKSVPLEPDHIYIVPKDRLATIDDDHLVIPDEAGAQSYDRLLRSLADSLGSASAAVILAGSGADGVLGAKRVKEAGGVTMCQLATNGESTELPRSASALGVIDMTLPLPDIGVRLHALANPSSQLVEEIGTPSALALDEVLSLLRSNTGHDFSTYRLDLVQQRLARRMQVAQLTTLADYLRFLREHAHERMQLFRDLLLGVTDFFRDPASYAALAAQVIPLLFRGRRRTDQIRVWVAGCASGEEAYSVAMLLCEYSDTLRDPPRIQVFASDADAEELREARAGIYAKEIVDDVSQERLRRFFTRENDQYRVGEELRSAVLFSKHNLLRDPPFSRMDLICCRNALAALSPHAREHVLDAFHFALRPAGHLFLGPTDDPDLTRFTAVDREHRLFERRRTGAIQVVLPHVGPLASPGDEIASAHRTMLEHFGPPSVLVDENFDIVHATAHAAAFLQVPHDGDRSVLRLVHPALSSALHAAILAARESEQRSVTRVVRFDEGGMTRAIELRVRATRTEDSARAVLIMFDELASDLDAAALTTRSEQRIERLEDDLEVAREQLRATITQYERALDELRDSNDELRLMNDQLRGVTDELDAGRAALHAVNAQLMELNRDLRAKVDDISRTNGDLQTLLASTDLAVIFLDPELRIQRFTPRVQRIFNVIAADVGRPLRHITHRLEPNDLLTAASDVMHTHESIDREVHTRDERTYLARIGRYRPTGERVEGVVITFFDVTELRSTEQALRRSEAALHASEERLTSTLRATQVAMITHGDDLNVTWAYVDGKELSGDLTAVFPPGQTARYAHVVREVFATGASSRIELELLVGEKSQPYEFQVERAGDGVTAIGLSTARTPTSPA